MRSPFEDLNGQEISAEKLAAAQEFLGKVLMLLLLIALAFLCYAVMPKFTAQTAYDALGRSDCYAEGC